jgi:hypothetical protein
MRALRNVKTDKDGKTGAKLRILGNVDASRILPGTGLDYYGMMATMGSKIQQLKASRNAVPENPTRLQAAIELWGEFKFLVQNIPYCRLTLSRQGRSTSCHRLTMGG